jgi:hypothetical protein
MPQGFRGKVVIGVLDIEKGRDEVPLEAVVLVYDRLRFLFRDNQYSLPYLDMDVMADPVEADVLERSPDRKMTGRRESYLDYGKTYVA